MAHRSRPGSAGSGRHKRARAPCRWRRHHTGACRQSRGARAVPDVVPGNDPIHPDSPAPVRKRPPRAAYALPTLFTAGNIFLGFLSIVRSIHGVLHYTTSPTLAQSDFEIAAKTIGLATAT